MPRKTSPLLFAAATLLALSPGTASAYTNGWDWDEELQYREWNPEKLDWAHEVHPNHPSVAWILEWIIPPPRELWCGAEEEPTVEDCQIHGALMADWMLDFAGPNIQFEPWTYPAECASICYPD